MEHDVIQLRSDQLRRWDKNPRPQADPETRGDLRASILDKGVQTPLVVRPLSKKGQYEVIGGDTRRDIVAEAIADGLWAADRTVPAIVRKDLVGDDAAALDVAISDNLHVPMHPMDQYTAFEALIGLGRDVQQIATAYGISEKMVEKRLSYASLDPRARDMVKNDERGLDWAAAMTVASPTEQKEILDEIAIDSRRHVTAAEVQRRLENEIVPVRFALFDVTKVDAALVRKDLFDSGEPQYMPVADFTRLQDEALNALVAERGTEGWASVTVVTEREFDRWRYNDGIEDKAIAEVVFVRHASGEVVEHAGLQLRTAERVARTDSAEDEESGSALFGGEALSGGKDAPATERKTAYDQGKSTVAYLERARAVIAQSVVVQDRGLALAVMVASLMSDGTPKPLDGRMVDEISAMDPENPARKTMERKIDASRQIAKSAGVAYDTVFGDAVAALRTLDEDQLLTMLQVEFAKRIVSTMPRMDVLYRTLMEQGDVTLGSVWRPDRAFVETFGKAQLVDMANDILPARMTGKMAKQKQTDIAETLLQTIEDAHGDGARLQKGEREKVTSYAPALLAAAVRTSADNGIFGDADNDGASVFDDAA